MATLTEVWQQIESYLSSGISVIPVRDRDTATHSAKTPYGKQWKKYQETIIDRDTLFKQMDTEFNTTAVGILGGKVSGNLEIIDVDVKYNHGIDATLFRDLQQFYPELWDILRVHKTPSGGFHLLYRCSQPVEGNQKLAGRYATDIELSEKPKTKTYNFIETRGEGGYVVAPPALGYSILKDNPIPVITPEQRMSIINLCRAYTEIIKVEKTYKATAKDAEYYDTNPFEDFNNRCDPDDLMKELGWGLTGKKNSNFIWYTRPGKDHGISMSFNLNKRFFYCFTASTELKESHGYSPSILLSTLLHQGDRKKTYQYLIERGYGVIKPHREEKIAKRAAVNKTPLPPNISPSAAALHVAISQQMQQDHPYGVYWADYPDKGIIIDREQLYAVADGLGWKIHNDEPVQILANLIYQRTPREFFDDIKSYIREEDADLYKKICNAYESFIERHGKFTITRLQELNKNDIISDTKIDCFKFYENGMLHITGSGFYLTDYPKDKLIWEKSIRLRKFINHDEGIFVDFIERAIGLNEYILSVVGYLAHEFKDDTAGYIPVLSEQCQNPKDGGGSGKNIFANLLAHTTTIISKPGSQVKYDERFMQSWNFQKVFCVSDVPKNFDFGFLKELATGTGIMKKLFVNEYVVGAEDMPKFLISTNFSYEVKDGGIKRRVLPLEFTDFFTKQGGVDTYYKGAHFPNDWNDKDWGGYDTFIAMAVQCWLAAGRKITPPPLTSGGWMKQFEQTYGITTTEFIESNFEYWIQKEWISNEDFKKELETFYNENNVPRHYQPSSKKLYDAMDEYCKNHGVKFVNGEVRRVSVSTVKGKLFTKMLP